MMQKFIKIIGIFLILLISFNFVFAKDKTITVSGDVKSVDIGNKVIMITTTSNIFVNMWNGFLSFFNSAKIVSHDYIINISDGTNIKANNSDIKIDINSIKVGDKIMVTGDLVLEMTDTDPGAIDASEIVVFKARGIVAVIAGIFKPVEDIEENTESDRSLEMQKINNDKLVEQVKVFDKEECVSEGEPILVVFGLLPKVPEKCCEDLNVCGLSVNDNQSIKVNGFDYIIKGYCRKTCPEISYTDNKSNIQLPGSKVSILKPTNGRACISDAECCQKVNQGSNFQLNPEDYNHNCEYPICERNVCVKNISTPSSCEKDSDCTSDQPGCQEKENKGILNTIIGFFTGQNGKKTCKCNRGQCQLLTYVDKIENSNPLCDDTKCDDVSKPVCGSDGKSYDNQCEASRCKAQVVCDGKCPCKPKMPELPKLPEIPGKCTVGKNCIVPIPEEPADPTKCKDVVSLVCAANSKTYKNECEAKNAGFNVSCLGQCPCNLSLPPVNVCDNTNNPVCGFDGKTYQNICEAEIKNKVNIKCMKACPCPAVIEQPALPSLPNTPNVPNAPIAPALPDKDTSDGFCGESLGTCNGDNDCAVGGCSGTMCYAKTSKLPITTCDYKACYEKPSDTYCGCKSGKCSWYNRDGIMVNILGGAITSPSLPTPSTVPVVPTSSAPVIPQGGVAPVPPMVSSSPISQVMWCSKSGQVGSSLNQLDMQNVACYDFTTVNGINCTCN